MRELLGKIRAWVVKHKDMIIIGGIAYIIHLTIEGAIANLIYYKIAKPLYLGMVAA